MDARLQCEAQDSAPEMQIRGHPDMMSASEGGGGHGKADIVREVA